MAAKPYLLLLLAYVYASALPALEGIFDHSAGSLHRQVLSSHSRHSDAPVVSEALQHTLDEITKEALAQRCCQRTRGGLMCGPAAQQHASDN